MSDLARLLGERLGEKGVKPRRLLPTRGEAKREEFPLSGKIAATLYGPAQAFVSGAAEVVAAPLEAAGQIGEMTGLGGETLRRAAEGVRTGSISGPFGLELSAAFSPKMEIGGKPIVEPGFGSEIAGAAGQAGAMLAGGAAARGLGMGAKMATGLMGSTIQAQSMYREAEAAGADDKTKMNAFLWGTAIGQLERIGDLEALNLGGTLAKIDKRSGGQVKELMMRFVTAGTEGAIGEAGEEALQTFSEKIVAQKILEYAEPQEIDEFMTDVGRASLIGAIIGQGLAGTGQLLADREALAEPKPGGEAKLVGPAEEAAAEGVLAKAAEGPAAAPAEALTSEQAAQRFQEANKVEGAEVTPLSMAEKGEEVDTERELFVGLVHSLRQVGVTVPEITLVDTGEKLKLPAMAAGGQVVIDAQQSESAMRSLLFHETLHHAAPSGSEAFTKVVNLARQEFPTLSLRLGELYSEKFTKATGRAPFASVTDENARLAMVAEEAFAQGAELMPDLLEGILTGTDISSEALMQDRNFLQVLRDWMVAAINKLPKFNLKTTEGKRLQKLVADLTAPELRELGTPEQIRSLATALKGAYQQATPRALKEAAATVTPQEMLAPKFDTQEALDLALAPGVDVEEIEKEVEAEKKPEKAVPEKPKAPRKKVEPESEPSALTPAQEKRERKRREKKRKRAEAARVAGEEAEAVEIEKAISKPPRPAQPRSKRGLTAMEAALEAAETDDLRFAVEGDQDPDVVTWERKDDFVEGIIDRYWGPRKLAAREEGAKDPLYSGWSKAEIAFWGRTGYEAEVSAKALRGEFSKISGKAFTLEEAGDFLQHAHAHERNVTLAKRDEKADKPEGWSTESKPASGIRSSVARKYVRERLEGPHGARYRRLQRWNRKSQAEILDSRFRDGAISKELYDSIRGLGWTDYVSLRHTMKGRRGLTQGAGFGVSGDKVKRAKGRTSKADNPIVNLTADAASAIIERNKTRVMREMLTLAENNPDPKVWAVVKDSLSSVNMASKEELASGDVDPTRAVMREIWDQRFERPDLAVPVRRDGDQYWIVFNPDYKGVAEALKNQGVESLTAAARLLGPYTRFLGQMYTSYSPTFGWNNFRRDLQFGLAGLEIEHGATAAKWVLKNVGKAIKGYWDAKKGKDTEWAARADKFRAAGGEAGWFFGGDMESMQKDIEKAMKAETAAGPRAASRKFFEFIENANKSIENGIRLAAFSYLTEVKGMPVDEAVVYVKEMTTNFNMKGKWVAPLGSSFLFMNASLQGNRRNFNLATKTKKGARRVAGIVLSMALYDMLLYATSGDDEDGDNAWDAIPEYEKDRTLYIPNPGGKPIKVWTLPYGRNIFFTMGRKMSEAVTGRHSPGKITADTLESIMNAASPIGTVQFDSDNPWADVGRMLAPSAFDIPVDLMTNTKFTGASVAPDPLPWDRAPAPAWARAYSSTPSGFVAASKFMSNLGGGTATKPSTIPFMDTPPEFMLHILKSITGGTGKDIGGIPFAIASAFEGDFPEAGRNLPILRAMMPSDDEKKSYWVMRQHAEDITYTQAGYEYLIDNDEKDAARKYKKLNKTILDLGKDLKRLDKSVSKLSNKSREATGEAKAELELETVELVREFNRKVTIAKESQ